MANNKTVETDASVTDFINTIASDTKRNDCFRLVEEFEAATGFTAKMWGPAIIGFGTYHYRYESGREGDSPLAGFSPRKDSIVLYFASSFPGREDFLNKLGKPKTGKVCVYIKKLEDIDTDVLKEMIRASVTQVRSQYPD
ncbi:DUF1801 domain-containing protein [Flavihumibacter sp. R14]|nr:DUF1801 domain-containing protein [Flavihumibacter soli]